TIGGRANRTSLELLAKGRELSGKLGGANVALVVGHDVAGTVDDVSRHGAERVHVAEYEALREYVPERWVAAVSSIVRHDRPHVLLIPATLHGRDLGPRVAGELQLGMTGDCVDLGIDRGGRLIQFKPAYGGNIVSVIMGATTPQLATVRPRMFEPLEPRDGAEAPVRRLTLGPLPEPRTSLLERGDNERAFELDEASVVLAIGDLSDNGAIEKIRPLAAALGAAIGGDRKACEAGLLPRSRQLGLLGRAVAPRLY